ncbi:hypothetical protein NKH77_25795 [Streptomyces sp. M19]
MRVARQDRKLWRRSRRIAEGLALPSPSTRPRSSRAWRSGAGGRSSCCPSPRATACPAACW